MHHDGERVRFTCRGHLTYSSCDAFRPLLDGLDGPPGHEIVVDLGELSFLDTNGLGMLLILREHARSRGRRIAVVNIPPRVLRMLDRSGGRALLMG
ncbi:STAS domain-containing protein [Azospirillum halopraeferens]|uniref:STAS domain-containing protein n=1 Tax=Azospirillum halopraeferens TaxID=34010 RepID=UPI00040CDFA6|nr:STAS domain-containing protein [Azospirillum halopraeferens]